MLQKKLNKSNPYIHRHLVIFLLAFLLSFSTCFGHEYKISIVAVTKNDHNYLKEWIDYHLIAGIDHFYIYDNNDHDLTRKLLEPYIKQGLVDYILWSSSSFPKPFCAYCQPAAYFDCAKKAVGHSEWLAIIDTDEFILPMEGTSVIEILEKHYKYHSQIYVQWKMFGTSYVLGGPRFPILPHLTRCAKPHEPLHNYGKTIVRPEIVSNVTDPHVVVSVFPRIDGSGNLYTFGQYATKYLRINHYTFRDEYYYSTYKIPRLLNAEYSGIDPVQAEQYTRKLNNTYCEDECFDMIKLINRIKTKSISSVNN